MTWPTTFASLAAGNQPLALFDAMFAQVAQMVAIPCTAAGTNSLTLTPIGSAPTIPSYQNFSSFRYVAANNSTGLMSAQFAALASLPIYLADGVTQASTGANLAGQEYVLVFAQALNGGAGGFFLEAASVPVLTPVAGSTLTNLAITNNPGSPNTQLNVSYDELVMNTPSGAALRAVGQSFTINSANVGVVNGLDAGSIVANTWYYVWGISNGAIVGGLLSSSSSAPSMPAGYTFKKRIGTIRAGAGGIFVGTSQRQRRVQFINGGNGLTTLPTIISGASGNPATPVYTAVSVGAFVPPTSISIGVVLSNSAAGSNTIAAPNNAYGATGSATNPPALSLGSTVILQNSVSGWWLLESGNVYYASSGAGGLLQCLGWEENI